ncbi:hypothetical protein GRI39_06660 [Altererythrobacter indicus]|uniref:Uncharacterized protein n=1 Tax=Altericroceibacterium indicum TaxID=374177 RepID=A0A845A8Z3_9SPHN|nr:hypothetical protein [Altericroceibacterium indicum]MXP25723.1 hypothetical protein [Altericroceibacterium indicum]
MGFDPKSMHVIVTHPPVRDESGPDFETYKHAYNGHHAQLQKLPKIDFAALNDHLSPHHSELLESIKDRQKAKYEIARGRYPYEDDDGRDRFPSGKAGRSLAEEWLGLARSLAQFWKNGPSMTA